MGFHDRSAELAFSKGHKAEDFSAAAQRHANAFWFWLVAAALVAYFGGWWAAIPGAMAIWRAVDSFSSTRIAERLERLESPPTSAAGSAGMSIARATEIVRAYASTLEHASPVPGIYADEKRLPYPKQEIREALLVCMRASAAGPLRTAMATGYVLLPDFQPGIGDTDLVSCPVNN